MGGQRHALATLTSGKRPGAHCIEGSMDPRVGRDTCGKSCPYRDSIPGPSSQWRGAIPTELSRPTTKGRRKFISRSRCPLSLLSWAALPWRWRNYDCSKRRELRTQRHGVTCQKIWMLSNAAVSNRRCRFESICWMGRGGRPTRNVSLDGSPTAGERSVEFRVEIDTERTYKFTD